MMRDRPDTVIYGAGSVAERFLAVSNRSLGRIWFVSTVGGGEFRGQPVLPAEVIAQCPDADVIVASSFRRQILETLSAAEIDDRRVSWYIADEDRIASTEEIRMLWDEHARAASLRNPAKLMLHHVGGRGFGVALSPPARFNRDLTYVLYEADADCAREMAEANPHENFHVLPYCLGRENGRARLNIMSRPSNSSLLELAPAYGPYSCEITASDPTDSTGIARLDAIFEEEIKVARQVDVETRTLDDLVAEGSLPYGAVPDVLSLDTQGTELDILSGAVDAVRSGVLVLALEIAFHSFYQGQTQFARLLDFADDAGFHFGGFTNLREMSPYRAPLGQRGKGFTGFGDATFFRRIETLDSLNPDPKLRSIKAYKLALIALSLGHLEYAVQAIDYAHTQPGDISDLGETLYVPFLDRVRALGKAMPVVYLHNEVSSYFAEARQCESATPLPSTIRNVLAAGTTPLEALLTEYGFTELAETVRDRRRQSIPFAARPFASEEAAYSRDTLPR